MQVAPKTNKKVFMPLVLKQTFNLLLSKLAAAGHIKWQTARRMGHCLIDNCHFFSTFKTKHASIHRFTQQPKESFEMGISHSAIPPRDDQYFSIIFYGEYLYFVHTTHNIVKAIQKRCEVAGYTGGCCNIARRGPDGTTCFRLRWFVHETKGDSVRSKSLSSAS